jgi:acetyl-CoA C-acetyltransferase
MNPSINDVYIVDAVRIPRARAKGEDSLYNTLKPVNLLKPLFQALSERNNLNSEHVEDVLLGCSTQSGDQGANLAKISALYAGWSDHVSGVTLNRFCCSGLDAINLGAAKIMAGMEGLVVAGGVEKLTSVPMFADKGAWFSDPKVMEKTRFLHMGLAADLIAVQENFSREQLDELALKSHQKASLATKQGYFTDSLIPVLDADGKALLNQDEGIRANISLDKLAQLPASFSDFVEMGQKVVSKVYPHTLKAIHSAGNSPGLVDGASLVLLASKERCRELNLTPRARIRHFANASDEPVKMLTGHIRAMEKMFKDTGLTIDDIDLWEVNESFAASVLKFQQHFNIDDKKLNVNGSAIAMGHPLGATGGNLLGMLLDELERQDKQRGVIAICGGAGVGVVTMIERIK